jgi:DNA polymerase III epsilon subunit-like protein
MIHLNGNVICAIDIETTGLDPDKHEIYEIAILPLDHNLEPRTDILPFDTLIKPQNIDDIDWEGMRKVNNSDMVVKACEKGLDSFTVADYLAEWSARLKLPEKKKMVPLAHNWAGIDKLFIQKWLGPLTFNELFHFHYRDTMTTALYLNDRADAHVEQVPFPKVGLQYVVSQLKIETNGRAHNAIEDCVTVAKVYKKLLTFF